MHKLYDLKNMLVHELEEYGDRDSLDMSSLEIVDTLAHAIKNIDKIIDSDGGEYSGRDYDVRRDGHSYGRRMDMSRRDRRDRNRYSGDDNMIADLRRMMNDAPDERTRAEFERMIQRYE